MYVQAAIYLGEVLSIHMKKPQGFKYKSGMHLFFCKIPSLAFRLVSFLLVIAHISKK
jgi:hypothetical protein